jgi:hypothetical protein
MESTTTTVWVALINFNWVVITYTDIHKIITHKSFKNRNMQLRELLVPIIICGYWNKY